MSEGTEAVVIPVRAETGATAADIDRVVAAINRLGEGTQKSSQEGEKSVSTWQRVSDAAKKAGETYTYVVGALTDLANKVGAAVAKITALASEQDALDRTTQNLGLDLNAAADAAGRFTDETEVMDAANRLHAAGLHLTQDQLEQVTARAAITAQTLRVPMTEALSMVTSGIITGREQGLIPFGREMAALGGTSHTAQERLDGFVSTTRNMPRATDDAATSMARFRDSIDDTERAMAASFTSEIFRLHEISEATRGVTHDTEETNHQLRAFSETAARLALQAANGIGAVVGEVVAQILHVVGVAAVQISQLNGLAHGELPGGAAYTARVTAANREWLGAGSAAADARSFADARQAALDVLDADTGANANTGAVRGYAVGRNAHPGESPAMARLREMSDAAQRQGDALAANATNAANRHSGGGGAHRPNWRQQKADDAEREQLLERRRQVEADDELERAFRGPENAPVEGGDWQDNVASWMNGTDWAAKRRAEREGAESAYANSLQGQLDARSRLRRAARDASATELADLRDPRGQSERLSALRTQSTIQREQGHLNTRAQLEDARDPNVQDERVEQMRLDAELQREQRQLNQRYQMQRSFTDRWEELHGRQTSAAEHASAGISAAFESMGKAIGDHVQALIEGRESVGQALQGMASDTLLAIGKQAVAKGGMEIAEGIAAAAGIVTAPLAAGHFAAGAAFLAVGAAAGITGAAIAPSAPSAGASAGASAPSRETVAGSGYNGQTVGPPVRIENYYAPVFGRREGTDAEVGDHMGRYTRASDARLQRERN